MSASYGWIVDGHMEIMDGRIYAWLILVGALCSDRLGGGSEACSCAFLYLCVLVGPTPTGLSR